MTSLRIASFIFSLIVVCNVANANISSQNIIQNLLKNKEKVIHVRSLLSIDDSNIITVAVDDSHGTADYYCESLSNCDGAIQEAICSLKGLTVGNNCGPDADLMNNPDFNVLTLEKGGIVNLFPGTYTMNRNVVLYSNIVLEGSGKDHTTLELANSADPFVTTYGLDNDMCDTNERRPGLIRASYPSTFMTIGYLTLDGNRYGQSLSQPCADGVDAYEQGRHGVYLDTVSDITLDNVKSIDFQENGFHTTGIEDTFDFTERLKMTNCEAINNYNNGISLNQLSYGTLTHNLIFDNRRHGIDIATGTRKTELSNNQIIENGDNGVNIRNNNAYRTSEITMSGNVIDLSGDYGIELSNAYFIQISNNQIYGGDGCMMLSDNNNNGQGTELTLVSSNICDSDKGIIVEKDSNTNTFVNNVIEVMYSDESVGITIDSLLEPTCVINDNIFLNVVDDNVKLVSDQFGDSDSVVYTLIKDRKFNVKVITNTAGTMKTFGETDLIDTDIHKLENPLNNQLLDSTMFMIVELTNENYYPTHLQYSDFSSENFGIQFDIPLPVVPDWETPRWRKGLNLVRVDLKSEHYFSKIEPSEYQSDIDFDWGSMTRLQISRSNPTEESAGDTIAFELIQIGKTAGFE